MAVEAKTFLAAGRSIGVEIVIVLGLDCPEAESVELNISMASGANGRSDELALVAPGTAADNAKAWIAAPEPR